MTSSSSSKPQFIWGIHPVLLMLHKKPELIREITIEKAKRGQKISEIIKLAKISKRKLNFITSLKLAGQINHQGIMAETSPPVMISLGELLAKGKASSTPLLLALDNIHDPRNLGSIIRSAAAVNATGIIMSKDRSAPLSGVAAKTAAGTLACMDICTVTNLAVTLKQLKEQGFWIFGAAGETAQTIYQADFTEQICLVIGNEEKGIRPLVKKQCDFLVKIPITSGINSLNASVAAGVILFEIIRQRMV